MMMTKMTCVKDHYEIIRKGCLGVGVKYSKCVVGDPASASSWTYPDHRVPQRVQETAQSG